MPSVQFDIPSRRFWAWWAAALAALLCFAAALEPGLIAWAAMALRHAAIGIACIAMALSIIVPILWGYGVRQDDMPGGGWAGEEMKLSEADIFQIMNDPALTAQDKKKILACAGVEYEPKGSDTVAPISPAKGRGKYIARDVPAHESRPDVLVDEYSPAYISKMKKKIEGIEPLKPGEGSLEIEPPKQ